MMKHCFLLLSVLGAVLAFAPAYGTSISTVRCEFFFHGEPVEDEEISDLLKTVELGGAVEICSEVGRKREYFTATAVSKKGDVSSYSITRVFKIEEQAGYRWDKVPPKNRVYNAGAWVRMRIGADDVRQDGEGFIGVEGMSTEEFSALNKAWADIRSSKWLFHKALLHIRLWDLSVSDLKSFKKDLYEDGKDLSHLNGVYCTGKNFFGMLDCGITVGDQSQFWSIYLVLSGDAIGIKSIVERPSW